MELQKTSSEHDTILAQAETIVISSLEQLYTAKNTLDVIKAEIKTIKDYFKPKKQKAKQVHDDWVKAEKKACEQLEQAKDILTHKIKHFLANYMTAKQLEYDNLKSIAKEEGLNADLIPTNLDMPIATRKTWHVVITDFNMLPDEYKVPDMTKLNKMARDLKEHFNIPGAKAEYDVQIL